MKATGRIGLFLHSVGLGILVFLLNTPVAAADQDAFSVRSGVGREITEGRFTIEEAQELLGAG